MGRSVLHDPRCRYFHEPPTLRDPSDCNCGAYGPPLPAPQGAAGIEKKKQSVNSMGIWAWLMIVENEAEKLSEGAQVALQSLREDLKKLAADD